MSFEVNLAWSVFWILIGSMFAVKGWTISMEILEDCKYPSVCIMLSYLTGSFLSYLFLLLTKTGTAPASVSIMVLVLSVETLSFVCTLFFGIFFVQAFTKDKVVQNPVRY